MSNSCYIQVYDLGEDGRGMGRVAAISQQTMVQNAALMTRSVTQLEGFCRTAIVQYFSI